MLHSKSASFMQKTSWLLTGAAAGSLITFFLDPQQGRRRRVLVRDQAIGLSHDLRDSADRQLRNFNNRLKGMAARTRFALKADATVDNEKLVQRVRSKMGRKVSHPQAIEVVAHEGTVTLLGHILSEETTGLLTCISSVKGVKDIINELESVPHAEEMSRILSEGAGAALKRKA